MGTMAAAFSAQLTDTNFNGLSFEERLSILVDAEWSSRKSNRLQRLIRNASYSIPGASMEDVCCTPERQLDKAQLLRLASCSYIDKAHNVIILGATGTGKTYLSCALGVAANRNFFASKYIRLPDLLVEIALARGDGSYRELMRKYKKIKLLILDEWLLYPLKESEARDLLELVEARSQVASTIFCSQFDVPGWHESLADPTLADAICDRIVYNSHTVTIKGESMRKLAAVTD
jgi:DNA replication protein DnaC